LQSIYRDLFIDFKKNFFFRKKKKLYSFFFDFLEVSIQTQYSVGPSSSISSICVPLLHQHPIGLFGLRLGYGLPLAPHRVTVGIEASKANYKKK